MPPRDSQRSRVYAWEQDAATLQLIPLHRTALTLDQCRQLVGAAWAAYRLPWPAPLVHDGRGHRRATASPQRIDLPRWARQLSTVLHEAAHTICMAEPTAGEPPHGPAFVRVYIDLLQNLGGADPDALAESAAAHRVRVAPRTRAPQPPQPPSPHALARLSAIDARLAALERERQSLLAARHDLLFGV